MLRACTFAIPLVWLGAVGAISFMEAPLKFMAPGVSRADALSIGRVVFQALNRVELALLAALLLVLWRSGTGRRTWAIAWPLTTLLAVQTWMFFPLDERARRVLAGEALPMSTLHYWYVGLEIVKVGLLVGMAVRQIRAWRV